MTILINEVAARQALGGISAKGIYNLRRRGLPFVKIGTRVMYSPADLAAWVQTQKGQVNHE